MSLAITVLGSSGMFQTIERACAGYLLDIDGRYIWLDAGAGTWLNLQRAIDFSELSGVLLTHGHPDHTTDVLQAYHARQYGLDKPLPPIPLWAPQETIDRLTAFAREIGDSFDVRAIDANDEVSVGAARLTFVEMAHPAQTLGVRLACNGVTVAFSSDTGAGADFESLAGSADLFVCEATSQDSDDLWEGHLRASQAGEIAARVGVKRLLLTHLRPGRDHSVTLAQARAAAPGLDVDLAVDGARLELA
jgi:ribonuclease BN (tRNA processing enzyme)